MKKHLCGRGAEDESTWVVEGGRGVMRGKEGYGAGEGVGGIWVVVSCRALLGRGY